MAMAKKSNSPPKILMFPWLAHGHVFPFLELSKALSNTPYYFDIYFCSTPIILASIKQSLAPLHLPNLHLIELHLPPLQQLPPHYHTTKNIPPHLSPILFKAFQLSKPLFAQILTDLAPDLLIYDGFQPWAPKQAKSLGIPAVFFSTSGAAAVSYYHHILNYKGSDDFPFPWIYLDHYHMRDLAVTRESFVADDVEEGFDALELSSEIVLMKSCRELEIEYMEYLSKLCCGRVVPVGPLVAYDIGKYSDCDIFQWLDGKDPSSTLYISFGSENFLTKDQMAEIAKGLELTNVHFIWMARSPNKEDEEGKEEDEEEEEAIPQGFIDRTNGRGLILRGWAPQVNILAHPNLGGFLSHCGWSSIMESIYFGVPVVGLPLKLDQPLNCRLLVEKGIGVEVRRDEEGKFDGEGVAKAIKKVMVDDDDDKETMRRRVRGMSDKIRKGEDEALSEVARDLSRLCSKEPIN